MIKTEFQSMDEAICRLYENREKAFQRYKYLKKTFCASKAKTDEAYVFSAPGRIEVCGNHTDHQGGKVLTAAIDRDALALAARNRSGIINVHSMRLKPFSVDTAVIAPQKNEFGKSAGMVRGIVAAFKERGVEVGGMDICVASDVATGSGISSSAAFETVIATAINTLYNDGKFTPCEIAQIGRFAESAFFGKPCGLMDQTASAFGGCIAIDFSEQSPSMKAVNMDCVTKETNVFIVHTGGSHAKLGKEYSSIVREMNAAAEALGKKRLCEVSETELMRDLNKLRNTVGDRPVLRAMHYFAENKRVERAIEALELSKTENFLKYINESGDSSALLLQNVYLDHVQNKSVALALAMTKNFFAEANFMGACRIHGGGFMGTILVFIPKENAPSYKEYMDAVFGEGSADEVHIREHGGIAVAKADI